MDFIEFEDHIIPKSNIACIDRTKTKIRISMKDSTSIEVTYCDEKDLMKAWVRLFMDLNNKE